MFDSIGICLNAGKDVACFKAGKDVFSISKIGKTSYILLNGRAVLSAQTDKEFMASTVPVFIHILKQNLKTANIDDLYWKPYNKTLNLSKLIETVSNNLKPAGVFVLEMKPDEITDNKPVQASTENFLDKLKTYYDCLSKFGETIDKVHHNSCVLLKTNLDRTVWGSKIIMPVFSAMKTAMDGVAEDLPVIEGSVEQSRNNLNKLYNIFSRKLAIETKQINGEVIKDFTVIKSFMSKLAQIMHPMYTIDSNFRSATEYPATWFLDGGIYMPFMYDYENLLNHVVKTADIEIEVMEPLLIRKITGA